MSVIYSSQIENAMFELRLDEEPGLIHVNSRKRISELIPINYKNLYLLFVDNKIFQFFLEEIDGGYKISINGSKHFIKVEEKKSNFIKNLIRATDDNVSHTEIKAPMPGLILKINITAGQVVKKGDSMIIIEAMKMENEICAKRDGVISEILVKEKESVEKDNILFVMQ